MTFKQNQIKAGFTLVELSVTLAIISLIIVSITSGSHLLHVAKLNRLVKEFTSFNTAIDNFKTKYSALPGDMGNAFSFWGSNCATSNNLCNGDGNEFIDSPQETLRAWQHLVLANMINGKYSGEDNGTPDAVIEVNVPPSVIKQAGFSTGYIKYYDGDMEGNAILLGACDQYCNIDIINAADASIIDERIDGDDVFPNTGKLGAAGITGCVQDGVGNDVAWNAAGGGNYAAKVTGDNCHLFYMIDNRRR